MGRVRRRGPHGLLLVDKPRGITSHGAVSLARRALGTRTIGHGGTLDPMATGLLVFGVGEGTKLLAMLGGQDKTYRAALKLGQSTHTWDADSDVVAEASVPLLALSDIEQAARRFVGTYMQRAPAVSAIKRGGEALYKKVRRGEHVEAPLREVTVRELRIESYDDGVIHLWVRCAKGFYVRSLGQELAAALGTLGHLCALRREQSGDFSVDDAVAPEVLEAAAKAEDGAREALLARFCELSQAVTFLPQVVLDDEGQGHALHGRPIPLRHIAELRGELPEDDGQLALFDGCATPLGLAIIKEGSLRVARGFRM